MRFLYTDFSFTLVDYISVLKKREIAFEWVIPLLAALLVYFKIENIPGVQVDCKFMQSTISTLINLFAILVGFTMASIAIFTTADIKKVPILEKKSDREIRGHKIKNHRFIFVNLIYSSVSSLIMLITTLVGTILLYFEEYSVLILSVLVFGTLHVLFLSIRNITSLYFVFFNQK